MFLNLKKLYGKYGNRRTVGGTKMRLLKGRKSLARVINVYNVFQVSASSGSSGDEPKSSRSISFVIVELRNDVSESCSVSIIRVDVAIFVSVCQTDASSPSWKIMHSMRAELHCVATHPAVTYPHVA
jgi:hypothetical protein